MQLALLGYPWDWIALFYFIMTCLKCNWELNRIHIDGSVDPTPTILSRGITSFGRALTNTLQCMSLLASRNHCTIKLCDDGSIFLMDLNSLNGTFLASGKILPKRAISLNDGDIIGVGVEITDRSLDTNCIFKLKRNLLEGDLSGYGEHTVVPAVLTCPINCGNSTVCMISTSSSHTKSSIKKGSNHEKSSGVQLPLQDIPSTSRGFPMPHMEIKEEFVYEIIDINSSDSDSDRELQEKSELDIASPAFNLDTPKIQELAVNSCDNDSIEIINRCADKDKPCEEPLLSSCKPVSTSSGKVKDSSCPDSGAESVIISVGEKQRQIETDDHKHTDIDVALEVKENTEATSSDIAIISNKDTDKTVDTDVPAIDKSDIEVIKRFLPAQNINTLDESESNKSTSEVPEIKANETAPLLSLLTESSKATNHQKTSKNLSEEQPAENIESVLRSNKASVVLDEQHENKVNINSNISPLNNENELVSVSSSREITKINECEESSLLSTDTNDIAETSNNTIEEQSNEKVMSVLQSNKDTIVTNDVNKNSNTDTEKSSSTVVSLLKNEISQDIPKSESSPSSRDITKLNEYEQTKLTSSDNSLDQKIGDMGKMSKEDEENEQAITEGMSDVDKTIMDIIKKRLSGTPRKFNIENEITYVETDKEKDDLKECPMTESFTADDDDIIVIDDDDLPCSQMFDVHHESPPDQDIAEECPIDLEEDEVSDTDSADEWFQKLSQSGANDQVYDIVSDDEDFHTSANEREVCEEPEEPDIEKLDAEIKQYEVSEERSSLTDNTIKDSLNENQHIGDSEKKLGPSDDLDEEIDIQSELSEPFTMKIGLGSKRKLPDSSDDEEDQIKLKKLATEIHQNQITDNELGKLFTPGQTRKRPECSKEYNKKTETVDKKRSKKPCSEYSFGKDKNIILTDRSEIMPSDSDKVSSKKRHMAHRRKSSVESDESSGSSSSQKTLKIIDIFDSEKSCIVIAQQSNDKTCVEKDTIMSKVHMKKVKLSKRKLSSESDSTICSDYEPTDQSKPRQNVLQTLRESISDSSKPSWEYTMEGILYKIDQECKANPDKYLIKQPSYMNDCEVTQSASDLVENGCQDVRTDEIKKLTVSDIEKEIKPNIIRKIHNVTADLDNKDLTPLSTATTKEIPPPEDKIDNKISEIIEENLNDKMKSKRKLRSFEDAKLDAVRKKINSSNKTRSVPIIDAKAMVKRRRQSAATEMELKESEGKTLRDHITETPSENWLSKDQPQKKPVMPISKLERKAYIKAKLKCLNRDKKGSEALIEEEKPKTLSTAKNTTKITSKSRNEIFLDTLVSGENNLKESSILLDKNDKGETIKSLSTFKIPRRQSKADEETQVDNQTSSKPADVLPKHSNKPVKSSGKITKQPKTATKNSKTGQSSVVEQILSSQIPNSVSNKPNTGISRGPVRAISGVENEEPAQVVRLSANDFPRPLSGTCSKPIMKQAGPILKNGKTSREKNVKFHRAGDSPNTVYVYTLEIGIAEGAILKPVTKNVAKKDPPPKKKTIESQSGKFVNYWEETIHQICKWNTSWFEERKRVKGEPGAFSGQVYHLMDDYACYNAYRRGMLPLLFYELWQIIAKQHDMVVNKTKTFNFEINTVSPMPVKFRSIPPQTSKDERVLYKLDCQMLVERSNQKLWPRAGDLLVVELRITGTPNKKKRILGYLDHSLIRMINSQEGVSKRLKELYPRASQIMHFSLYIKKTDTPIDMSKETRIVVLKNIKSDLRLFNALDRLASSPLLPIICHPKENRVPSLPTENSLIENPLISYLNESQQKAVSSVVRSIVDETNVVHMIHGPPGCGKSEVIIKIVQLMLRLKVNRESNEKTQILLCAPSNAAIDDVFFRLMNIRENLEKKWYKFNMIRVGRPDMAHKNVSTMTLDFLVEKEMKKDTELIEDEDEKRVVLGTLEAKKNQLNYQLANLGRKSNDFEYIKAIEKKLAETIQRIKQLESGTRRKPLNNKELLHIRKEKESKLLQNADIIATTLSSCFNTQMETAFTNNFLRFSCCIVDEATQCTEPETLIPLMLGINKLVLVGDPMQLPPTVLSSTAKEHGLDRSLFARQQKWWQQCDPKSLSQFKSRCHFLDTQYRMHPEIALWPSDYFYKKSIHSHKSLELRSAGFPLLPYIVLSHDHCQSPQNESNPEEVKVVVSLVRIIMKKGFCEGKTVGVITPYNQQKDAILKELRSEAVEVGTIDSYQGRERDIIIFSCMRTDGIGFMSDMERLNVALTRARHSLIVCGNFRSLQMDKTWESLLKNAKDRGLLRQLKSISTDQDLLNEICKPGFANNL